MKKNKIIPIIIGLVLISLIAYYFINKGKETGEPSKTEIIIGYPTLRIALPVLVAYDQGYFEDEGLNVKLKSYQTAQPMMDALVSGKINFGGFCALPITFGAMARSKTDLLFLGGMYEDDSHPISVLLVKDTTIIKNIQDLKGKKIGILPTRAYEVWLQGILESNNIDPKDVIIRQVKPNLQAEALNNGSVDALFTNDPSATITMSKGYGMELTKEALVPKSTGMTPFYFGSFNVRKDFADKNPETIKKVSNALDKASKFIKDNPDAKLIMAKENYLPEAFRPIVKNFPNSYFKTSNNVSDENLKEMKDFYFEKQVLPVNIETKGLQYKN
jgi:NitT/TauT family transport system substrate-binding protein